jgi:hypothetical protein
MRMAGSYTAFEGKRRIDVTMGWIWKKEREICTELVYTK